MLFDYVVWLYMCLIVASQKTLWKYTKYQEGISLSQTKQNFFPMNFDIAV